MLHINANKIYNGELKMLHDIVVLYSGGSDSRMLLELAKDMGLSPYCILIDYEQLHKEELKFVKRALDQFMGDKENMK